MSTIITRNSATSGSTPSSLVQGELAINVTDGKLFYGSGSGNVVKEFTGSASGGTTNTGSLLTTASFSNPNLTFTKGNGSTFNVNLTSLVPTSASYALTSSYSVNPTISGSINNVDYIDFTTDNIIGTNAPAWKEGRLFYDSGSGALAMYNWEQDVTLNIGQEQWLRARNQTGTLITNGTVVRLVGAIGDRPTVEPAVASDQTNFFSIDNEIIGMATHDIEHGTDGFITTFGLVNGINTAAFNVGDLLWVSQSAGQFTNIPPSPPFDKTFVGIVTRQNANNGTVFMTPLTSIHFHDISSVSASVYQMGDLWMYRSGSVGQANAWINTKALTGSYGISGSLNATSFTGSLLGTSSFANNSLTSSFATQALTSSFATQALSASFAMQADSSSFATTALTASFLNDGYITLTTTSDQDVTNNNSANAPELFFSGSANAVYEIEFKLIMSSNNTTADSRFGFRTGTGGNVLMGAATILNISTAFAGSTQLMQVSSSFTSVVAVGTPPAADLRYPLTTTGTICLFISANDTIGVTFGNSTATIGATTRLWAGSTVRYKRIK